MSMLNELQPLIDSSLKRSFSAGSTILYQGEVPRSACIVKSGLVRVFSISPQGDEQIVMFHVAGEIFPSSWIFGKSPGTMFFYEASVDCQIAFCDRAVLIDHMLAKPERTHALLDYFTTNYSAFMVRVNALEQPKARDKLVYTLYYLCQRYGHVKPELNQAGNVTIPFALTHQNIASLVGLTRETTAIEMSKLKKAHVISYRQQHYTINIPKLMDVLGEDSLRDILIQ